MLALRWPLDPGLWTLAFGHWSRRTQVAIGTGRFRRSSFSARDGARNPLNQPSIIQQSIRRTVQTTIKSSSMKFRSPRLSKHRATANSALDGRELSVERCYERRPVVAREDFSLTDLTDLIQDHLVVGRKSGRPGGGNPQECMLLHSRSSRNLALDFIRPRST
jgi:hypothetical protein